jgi:hypothetical protein
MCSKAKWPYFPEYVPVQVDSRSIGIIQMVADGGHNAERLHMESGEFGGSLRC